MPKDNQRIAQMMAGLAAEPGLDTPPEAKFLNNMGTVASGYFAPQLVQGIVQALASKAIPAAQALGEAGAVFPDESLPLMKAGSKTGDPHALYAYKDNFGPEGSERAIYNVFGDPAHPALQKAGWGSSLPIEKIQQLGIPVVGREIRGMP